MCGSGTLSSPRCAPRRNLDLHPLATHCTNWRCWTHSVRKITSELTPGSVPILCHTDHPNEWPHSALMHSLLVNCGMQFESPRQSPHSAVGGRFHTAGGVNSSKADWNVLHTRHPTSLHSLTLATDSIGAQQLMEECPARATTFTTCVGNILPGCCDSVWCEVIQIGAKRENFIHVL